MFCPNCGAEYVEGVKECADCRLALVPDLPPPGEAPFPKYEKILTIFNVGDIAVIRSVFDAANIEYVFEGENFNLVDPMIQPARLLVNAVQVETARELLKEMTLHFWSLSIRDESGGSEGGAS